MSSIHTHTHTHCTASSPNNAAVCLSAQDSSDTFCVKKGVAPRTASILGFTFLDEASEGMSEGEREKEKERGNLTWMTTD